MTSTRPTALTNVMLTLMIGVLSTTARKKSWNQYTYPNPTKDFVECGMRHWSHVCDADDIIRSHQRVQLDATLLNLIIATTNDEPKRDCQQKGITGYIALLDTYDLGHTHRRITPLDTKMLADSLYNRYTKEENCHKAFVIVGVKQANTLWIKSGREVPISNTKMAQIVDEVSGNYGDDWYSMLMATLYRIEIAYQRNTGMKVHYKDSEELKEFVKPDFEPTSPALLTESTTTTKQPITSISYEVTKNSFYAQSTRRPPPRPESDKPSDISKASFNASVINEIPMRKRIMLWLPIILAGLILVSCVLVVCCCVTLRDRWCPCLRSCCRVPVDWTPGWLIPPQEYARPVAV